MELYDAINSRRTIRDFDAMREVPQEVLERILSAGLKAPSGNHLRDMHYVVVRGRAKIAEVVKMVGVGAEKQMQTIRNATQMGDIQKGMYLDAVPKQQQMLISPGVLVLPFYFQRGDFFKPVGVTTYNDFAATWCGIQNMMLAATAEGLACSIRIPIGDEPAYVTQLTGAPQGYMLCCYLGIGYPAEDAFRPQQVAVSLESNVHYDRWQ